MPRADAITVEGTLVQVLGAGLFRAELANGHRVVAHLAPKNRETVPGLGPGDKVRLEMSPFDMSKGRILA
ncbi:MAG TPA: translation initiation factor IF-1 [Candidatus Binatia bacterium]|nr:translation initiation factor IF-1 [Candidatus Binatia bacterium]